MDEVWDLVLKHGRHWFELVGGTDWPLDMKLGLETTALVAPVLAITFALIAITNRDGSG